MAKAGREEKDARVAVSEKDARDEKRLKAGVIHIFLQQSFKSLKGFWKNKAKMGESI